MSTELTLLAWSVVLGLVHLGAAGLAKRGQEPFGWAAGARDSGQPDYSGMAARLMRAQSNFMETFPFFAAVVLICHLAGRESALSLWGAQLYFWARVVYLPLYGFGTPYVRTLVWLVSLVGLCMVLVRCFIPA